MISIIDYDMGNVGSIKNMLRKIGVDAEITGDPERLSQSEKLILPGVGAFDQGMMKLKDRNLAELLYLRVVEEKIPILGICLGMQLMTQRSEEGVLEGLCWIDAETKKFDFSAEERRNLKVPHMGWNVVDRRPDSRLYRDCDGEMRFYFVHSYHVVCRSEKDVSATAWHGHPITASFEKNNIFGVQFHPEKSHSYGMKVLENFSRL